MQSRLKIFCEFRNIFSCFRLLTDTDIRGDAADVNVGATLVVDELLQAGLAQLGVVEEGGVGVDVGVDSFVHHAGLRVHLQVLVQLRAPRVLNTVARPQNLGSDILLDI